VFCDLNVPEETLEAGGKNLLETAERLGYGVIAVNHSVSKRIPAELRPPEAYLRAPTSECMEVLSRVTYVVENQANVASLQQCEDILRRFDIVAVAPTSERALLMCLDVPYVDLISLTLSMKMPFPLRPQTVSRIKQKNVHIELCYAVAVRDAPSRRLVAANGASIARATGGNAVIVSSGAQNYMELRAAHDVVNMSAVLFKMNMAKAQNALSLAPNALLAKARQRESKPIRLLMPTEGTQGGQAGEDAPAPKNNSVDAKVRSTNVRNTNSAQNTTPRTLSKKRRRST